MTVGQHKMYDTFHAYYVFALILPQYYTYEIITNIETGEKPNAYTMKLASFLYHDSFSFQLLYFFPVFLLHIHLLN
jgi:hypothetical protein